MLVTLLASAATVARVVLQRRALLNGGSSAARLIRVRLRTPVADVPPADRELQGLAQLRGNGYFCVEQRETRGGLLVPWASPYTAWGDVTCRYRLEAAREEDLEGVKDVIFPSERTLTDAFYVDTPAQWEAVREALGLVLGHVPLRAEGGEMRVRFRPAVAVYRVLRDGHSIAEPFVAPSPQAAAREFFPMAKPAWLAACVIGFVELSFWHVMANATAVC